MEVAAKAAVGRSGRIFQTLKTRAATAKNTTVDTFKRRYTEASAEGSTKLKTGKAIRDGIIATFLGIAAFFGIKSKTEKSAVAPEIQGPPHTIATI